MQICPSRRLLNAGKSVTIQFQVTVNSPFPAGFNSVSNQGTVSGSNFASVATDDPGTGMADDRTVTPVDAVSLSIGDVSVAEGAVGNRTITLTLNPMPICRNSACNVSEITR
jgi:hypothetical protein